MQDIFTELDISVTELTSLINENVNTYSILYGYSAEIHLRKIFETDDRIESCKKYDDHDTNNRHDLAVMYKGREYTLESKCIQNNSLNIEDDEWSGKVQVQYSSGHFQDLPNGEQFYSKVREFGEFDILAVATNKLGNGWEFFYALNRDLPMTNAKKIPDEYQHRYVKSHFDISPDSEIFVRDPFVLLERLHTERENTTKFLRR